MGRGQCDSGDSTASRWRHRWAMAGANDPTIFATTGLYPTLESRNFLQCAQTDDGIDFECSSPGPNGSRSRFESLGLCPPSLGERDSAQMFSTEHVKRLSAAYPMHAALPPL